MSAMQETHASTLPQLLQPHGSYGNIMQQYFQLVEQDVVSADVKEI